MKFITVVSLFLLGLGFSSHALSAAVPVPTQPMDIYQDIEKDHSQSRNLRGRPSSSSDIYNPNGCPPASRMQMLGNQCPLQGQRTLCCVQTRSGAWYSWVQCSSHMCSGPNNVATSFIAADTEDFDSEGVVMSTYEDLFEQQQVEQYDGTTKSLHQKSGAVRNSNNAASSVNVFEQLGRDDCCLDPTCCLKDPTCMFGPCCDDDDCWDRA